MITFTVKPAGGKLRSKASIREHVIVTAQSPDLPPRPPFDKTQIMTKGTVIDLQAFGYSLSMAASMARVKRRVDLTPFLCSLSEALREGQPYRKAYSLS
jgi:hypothetical protein